MHRFNRIDAQKQQGDSEVLVRYAGVASRGVAWLVPLIVILEFVGSTFGRALLLSVGYLALLLGAAWLVTPETLHARPERAGGGLVRWLAGIALVELGLVLVAPTLLSLVGRTAAWGGLGAFDLERDTAVLLPLLGAWPLAVGWAWTRGRRAGPRDYERLGLWIALLFVGLLNAGHRVQGLPVVPAGAAALGPSAVVLIALMVLPRVPMPITLLALAPMAVAVRLAGLSVWSPDPAVRDMLPLVMEAQDAFLRGDNPYAIHQMQHHSQVPLTYLPGLWLLSWPGRLAGLDLRITSLFADLVIVGTLGWLARTAARASRRWAEALAVAFAAVWLFSPSVQWNAVYAEPHPWWGVLVVTAAAFVRRRYWLGAASLGLALATRQFALALLPFAGVLLYRELGYRRALSCLGLTGAIASILYLPFVLADPDMFWFGTVRWLWEYGPAHESWFWQRLGFSGTLYRAGATEWMSAAQLLGIASMAGLALWTQKRHVILATAATAYVVVVMFNRIIWDSFYLGIFVLLAPLMLGRLSSQPPLSSRAPEPRSTPRAFLDYFGWTAVALSAAVAGFLVWSFGATFDQAGRTRVVQELYRRAGPRDLVVDRADRRLAFVRGPWLLDPRRTRSRVVEDPWQRSLAPDGPWSFERLWLVTRNDRDAELLSEMSKLGTVLETLRFGRYGLLSMSLGDPRSKLSEELGRVQVSVEQGGRSSRLTAQAPMMWKGPGPVEVAPRRCALGGGRWPLVFAHPLNGSILSIQWEKVEMTDRLLVIGGLQDPVVKWGLADVTVDVSVDGQSVGSVVLANRPGISRAVFSTERGRGRRGTVTLRVRTPNDAQRWVCLDAMTVARP